MSSSPYAHSPQFENGRFTNHLPHKDPALLPELRRWFFEKAPYAIPAEPVPVRQRRREDFAVVSPRPRVTWFGHSSVFVELDGQRLFVDPFWGDYASPGALFGVKRFYPPVLDWDALPPLDAVLLTHDHYDHLNRPTIERFAALPVVPRFVTPLGVAWRLRRWGIPANRITELDWWDEVAVGGVRIVATPARHFSGRFLHDRNKSLWCGWAMLGEQVRIYHGGDSAMFDRFREIGSRFGPFDLTMFDTGAYDPAWPDVHMGPEQAIEAHRMVGGKVLLPIHWSLFKLAYHGWTEPVERVLAAAALQGVTVTVPRPGESLWPDAPPGVERWWPALPWRTAVEQPIVSTGGAPPNRRA